LRSFTFLLQEGLGTGIRSDISAWFQRDRANAKDTLQHQDQQVFNF